MKFRPIRSCEYKDKLFEFSKIREFRLLCKFTEKLIKKELDEYKLHSVIEVYHYLLFIRTETRTYTTKDVKNRSEEFAKQLIERGYSDRAIDEFLVFWESEPHMKRDRMYFNFEMKDSYCDSFPSSKSLYDIFKDFEEFKLKIL